MTEQEQYRYRVNLICSCQNDVAFGRGPTEADARAIAEKEFVAHHGRKATYIQVLVEKAVQHDDAGGWHYEEERVALHVKLAHGVGRLILHRGGLAMFDNIKHLPDGGYVFESSDKNLIRAFWIELNEVRRRPPGGQGGRSTGHSARVKVSELKPIVKHLWPDAIEAVQW